MSTAQILLLGLLAGLTIFIGLPMGRLHDVGQNFKAFLSATATGILLFLFWDVLKGAIDPVESALNAIVKSAKTGKIGDGKVFVSNVEQAVRIRTDEKGEAAV